MSSLSNKFKFTVFMAPDTPTGGSGAVSTPSGGGEMSHEDMIEFMGEDDEKDIIPLTEKEIPEEEEDRTPPKGKEGKERKEVPDKELKEGDEEEDEDEEVDDLKEIEDELAEPTDEQLELVTPVRRREILKKYPELFKDFPYLEKAYYREQQFTELLPTIEDAKQAVEKSQVLDRFENDLLGGSTETILKAVKESNPNGFNKIVDQYLPTLAKVDEQAYFHVLGNITKHTIITMVQEAKRTQNESLQQAALLLNQFVFGTSDFKPPTNLSNTERPEDNTRERQIAEREQNFIRGQFENTRGDLNTRVNNTLRNTIDANIDPKSSMTDYVRKNASRDAMDTLETLINQDNRFKTLVDKLWEAAFKDGFTKTSVDRIRSAYVSKAKTLLPSVIKKARNEALKGMGRRASSVDGEETTPRRGPIPSGRPRSQQERQSGKITKPGDIPKGMKTIDFLNSD